MTAKNSPHPVLHSWFINDWYIWVLPGSLCWYRLFAGRRLGQDEFSMDGVPWPTASDVLALADHAERRAIANNPKP